MHIWFDHYLKVVLEAHKLFSLNFTFNLGPRFDHLYLNIAIQEAAKFNVFLNFFSSEKESHAVLKLKHRKIKLTML